MALVAESRVTSRDPGQQALLATMRTYVHNRAMGSYVLIPQVGTCVLKMRLRTNAPN
jgi:hypothetical protein